MRTFKEYYWLAPALGAVATNLSRVSPQTLSQLPSQTYDKVKSGVNFIKNKYKKRVVKGIQKKKVDEKLTKNSSMGDYIDDFYKSDAPQFQGKSKKKRRQMAIAAKLSNEEASGVTVSAIGGDNYERTRDMGPRKKKKSPGFSSYKVDGRKMKNQAQGISPFRKMYSI
tara:strand:- start:100 stop:603 length:504 start_codon:yes stop_codon:yes gene_type:complete